MKINIVFIAILVSTFFIRPLLAQDMIVETKVSQRASVTQRIGTTDVTVVYHSPLAKGRKVFGNIVPYDFVVDGREYPWRAGANQNTTIEFTHDVKIEGKPLSKGVYGLHILVSKDQWIYIFSKNSESWGSFNYDPKDDALRVIVKPEKGDYQDWLSYHFVNREPESVHLELHWTDVKCKFMISSNVTKNVIDDLMSKPDKNAEDFLKLAKRIIKQDSNDLRLALAFADSSIMMEEGFRNSVFKSELLIKMGDKNEGERLKEQAYSLMKNFDIYYYGLSILFLQQDKEGSFKVLNDYLGMHPENYPANLAMAEYYINDGDQKKATLYYQKAYDNCGENSKKYTRYMYLCNQLILDNMNKSKAKP